ncbi:MAG: hypothetical protein NTZ78_08665 [Candidatus Aureabacteria bacterium]|nr:hypothetical protein [Candidatus Auribacterota bacterium]
MKSILLLIAAIAIAVPSYGALNDGDLVVRGSLVQVSPTPNTPALFNVKPDGTIETFSTSDVLIDSFSNSTSNNSTTTIGPVVCPDGSILVAKAGNWIGDATPTPVPVSTDQPTSTPVPLSYWRQSGVYRFQPDGSVSTVAEGGILNSAQTSLNGGSSLDGIVCDSKGNIFVSHGDYPLPTTTPGGTPFSPNKALLKIPSGSGTPELFASENQDLQLQGFQSFQNMIVDSADNILVQQESSTTTDMSTGTPIPTPHPAKILQVSCADGTISTYATAAPFIYVNPTGGWNTWSEPFDWLYFAGTDIAGNLIGEGGFTRSPSGTGSADNILSFDPAGAVTTLLDISGTDGLYLLGANGAYMGLGSGAFFADNSIFGRNSIYILKAGSLEEEFIVHGDQTHNLSSMAYYSPGRPQLSVNVSEDVFGPNGSIAFGFGLTRGRTANEADLYFAIQSPASAGGTIQLINPNAAANKLPALIDLTLAQKFPTQIGVLRYGNGTTAVKGSGTVDLLRFSNIIIPEGTYTLLGVMTAPGANLFDPSKWLTPNKQPVTAKTTFSRVI